ncbi:MAG TPA: peptidoglycan DD-metalloendopeptidase family protein [Sphingomonas sp.]|jgi:septal ring factor EnvC (AmiA/AmiB activator)|nr:peptidoglycan DD-metalloendopeptidase family protein [Sphingomonas sp.]
MLPRSAREPRLKRLAAPLALLLIGAADPAALLREQRAAEGEAARLEQAAKDATGAAAKARALAGELDARIAASRSAVAASRARLDGIDAQRRVLEAQLNEARQPIARLIAATVALQRRPAALALVQPVSLDTQAHARAALKTIGPAIEARTAGLRAQAAQLDHVRAAAFAERTNLGRAEAQLVAQQAALGRYAGSKLRAAQDAAGRTLTAQDRALALANDAQNLQRAIDEARADAATAARLASLPRNLAGLGEVATRSTYALPAGTLVTGFGEQLDDGRRSAALILAPAPGARIAAPRGGKVAFAGPFGGYGRVVIIEHDGGWTSVVAGLADTSVTRGDIVKAGDALGSAPASDPAIRIELRYRGTPVAATRVAG